MADQLKNIRNPIIVFLIPIIGIVLVSNLLFNVEALTFLGIVLLGYPLYWFFNISKYLEENGTKISSSTIPICVGSLLILTAISVIVGAFISVVVTNPLIAYVPLGITIFIHTIIFIIFFFKFALGVQNNFQINKFITLFSTILIFPIPIYSAIVQYKINNFLKNNPIKNINEENATNYLKQYPNYEKSALISALISNFKLSEEKAEELYNKTIQNQQ